MKVLITGANGFVGNALVKQLLDDNVEVSGAVRSTDSILPDGVGRFVIPDILNEAYWDTILEGVNVVIHLAARVHVMNDDAFDPLTEFRKVNHDVTLKLATMASDAGVARFIYLSSIGVNGDKSASPFSELDEPSPHNDYAVSKYEAEHSLLALGRSTDIEVVIIRPPLVYGPNAPGNFASLIKWVNKSFPMPFGAIYNQRSFVALDNLVSFIIHCIEHPKAANEIFLISDGEDVSTMTLLQKVAKSMDKQARLIPIPISWMTFAAKLIGKEALANRLFGSLQVDSSKAKNLLGWKPVITMDEQLKKTAGAYLNKSND
jgi:nucleoside-diphosphate-sugar epimerase